MTYRLTLPTDGAAVVLGGSGGVGAAISRALAQAGSAVAMTYLSNAGVVDDLCCEIAGGGGRATAHGLDLCRPQDIERVVDESVREHGDVHTLVYAAGPRIRFAPLGEMSLDEVRRVVEVETLGFHAAVKAVLPRLRANSGAIVACVTFANHRVLPFDGQSAAPKAAIESMVRQLAKEEGSSGVRANAVGLGWIGVGLGGPPESERSISSQFGADAMETLRLQIPLLRPGRSEELAAAVVFLASREASYISGQTLVVDGGLSL